MRTVSYVIAAALAVVTLLCAVGLYLNLNPAYVPLPMPRPRVESSDKYEARLAKVREDIECLAILGYTEVRGESDLGQHLAVYVALNRYLHQRTDFGVGSVCDVVYRQLWNPKKKYWVSMFAGPVNYGDTVDRNSYAYRRAKYVAIEVYGGKWQPPAEYHDALYFYNPGDSDESDGAWHQSLVRLGKEGKHVFSAERVPTLPKYKVPPLLFAAQ